jgi:RNA recognition motif-containing protein
MKRLYVGNLSFNSSEGSVRDAFSAFGEVSSVHLVTDRDTGQPRGFGFVEMESASEAQSAIDGLNGTMLDGRSLNVNEARPRPERGNGGGGGGRRDRW